MPAFISIKQITSHLTQPFACSGGLPKGLTSGHFHQWPSGKHFFHNIAAPLHLSCHPLDHSTHLGNTTGRLGWQGAGLVYSSCEFFFLHVLLAPVCNTLGDRKHCFAGMLVRGRRLLLHVLVCCNCWNLIFFHEFPDAQYRVFQKLSSVAR